MHSSKVMASGNLGRFRFKRSQSKSLIMHIYPTTTYRVKMPQPFSKVIGHVQAKWGSTWHFFKKLRRIYIGNKQEKQSKLKVLKIHQQSFQWTQIEKMMQNDTHFVAYNLLVQKLWPHTFSCMSADVKQSSDTSNFVAPKLARWYILFFCFAVWYAHGACCKPIFSKSYRLVWSQSRFSCSGDPWETPENP